jgi:hypothetical protein
LDPEKQRPNKRPNKWTKVSRASKKEQRGWSSNKFRGKKEHTTHTTPNPDLGKKPD